MPDLTDVEVSFLYGEGDTPERREIIRNIRTILRTPVGSCPLYRDFGIDTSVALDRPADVAKNFLAVEISEAVERYETRVKVSSVEVEVVPGGALKAKVVITGGQ